MRSQGKSKSLSMDVWLRLIAVSAWFDGMLTQMSSSSRAIMHAHALAVRSCSCLKVPCVPCAAKPSQASLSSGIDHSYSVRDAGYSP